MTRREKLLKAYRELMAANDLNRDERAEKYNKAFLEYWRQKNDS